MDSKIGEAVQYLKAKPEYEKVLKELHSKYKKTGKLTGSIFLETLTEEEVLLLAPLNPEIYGKRAGKINVKKFIEFFSKGRFQGIDFLEVLSEYVEGELKTNREIREEKELKKERFFQKIIEDSGSDITKMWLKSLQEFKKYGYNIVLKLYKEDKEELMTIIKNLSKALDSLSYDAKKAVPLATFSSNITKDSHYFDIVTVPGKLLINAIAFLKGVNYINNAEGINDLLYSVGILRDEVSNSTITAGLFAYDSEGEVEGTKWFRRERQPLILNIYNLNRIERLKAKGDVVFIFENPTVFYEVLKNCEIQNPSLICISGQPNISSLMIIDKLAESGTTIYYSGDFDPEGLQICDNLKRRYGEKLVQWGMNIENYHKIKGTASFEDRINKLDNIADLDLQKLAEELKREKVAGYQELLVDFYCQDIIRILGEL
ncbi:TIGR02679 domain-containing protein [Clostridium thermarum]|uniref:TIGR02679 domain-containing protein n=1 Tax=Clostridium thermarum TaxID=1716543 RepID=UPI00111DE5D0|nr:TIGR02679 domain-containing protein [Clostridium thermarum]